MTRVVCVSDVHNHPPTGDQLPEGDLLIVAGDMTNSGTPRELDATCDWLRGLSGRFNEGIVVVAGNHDDYLERWGRDRCADYFWRVGAYYLEGEETEVAGLRVWGGPWIPEIWGAFNVPRDLLDEKWAAIPEGIDILVTHAPPAGVLDAVPRRVRAFGGNITDHWTSLGCEALRDRVEIVRPRLHVFGHIHESAGEQHGSPSWLTGHGPNTVTHYINAAWMNRAHDGNNPVKVHEL